MSACLLDTNVLSELIRPEPTASVITFLNDLTIGYISVITLNELIYGAQRLQDATQRQRITDWVRGIEDRFSGNILPIDQTVAHRAAFLRAQEARNGRTIHLADTLIAATALVHNIPLATRNTRNFEYLGVDLHDPWLDRS